MKIPRPVSHTMDEVIFMEFYPNEQEMKAIDCFIKDTKPPVVTSYDDRWKAPKGGRSDPDRATAPDGVSGNWK